MHDPGSFWNEKLSSIEKLRKRDNSAFQNWKQDILDPWLHGKAEKEFQNSSDIPIRSLYNSEDVGPNKNIGNPGEYPFTRGVYPDMYRGRYWTMRMFSGFGTPEDTNKRLKYLIGHGESGLSIAFDMPTLYGYDCSNSRADGEVGRCGVNVSSLKDMEVIFRGIDLGKVSTSMTINAPANILLAMYMAVAKKQKVPLSRISGTVQADILKEYIAQKEWIYPPEAHLRMIRDMMVFCTKNSPKWNYISISGYHIREAGSSAVQELAFTLADGFHYIDLGIESGLKVDDFAPRLSFFFNSSMNFFEEIAKMRAARRIWATVLKEKYGAKKERTMLMRFHTQTSGYTLAWQQPLNNIIRTTIEAMAGVLGGTQSLHTNSYDEAWALPSEEAVKVALRTQQIIAEESGVADTIDPLGGSYYLEWLTDEMEERAYRYFAEIDSMGGILKAIKNGYLQKEIANTSYKRQIRVEEGKEVMVGVNKYQEEGEKPINILKISREAERAQRERLKKTIEQRNAGKVSRSLESLETAMRQPDENLMPYIIDAVEAYATLEEICNVGRDVFGGWKEPVIV